MKGSNIRIFFFLPRRKPSLLVWAIFFLLCNGVDAQKTGNTVADSLMASIPGAENDTIRLRLYHRAFLALLNTNTDKAFLVVKSGLAHAQKMNWSRGIGAFNGNLGEYFRNKGNFDSAFYYMNLALSIHSKADDKHNMAVAHNNIGSIKKNMRADYAGAAQSFFSGLRIAEQIKDSVLIPLCLNNLGNLYLDQQDYEKSLSFGSRALAIREKTGDMDGIANCLESMGKTYYLKRDLKNAEGNFVRAKTLYESTGNLYGLASIWGSLSLVYEYDYRRVIDSRLKAREIWNEIEPLHTTAITNVGNLGMAYLDIIRYDTLHKVQTGGIIPADRNEILKLAEENLKSAIRSFEMIGEVDNRSYFLGALAELQESKGDFKNAYFNYKSYKDINDSIYSQENKNKIAASESQAEIDKKNAELRISQLALSNQRRTLWGLAGGLLLLAIIGVLLFRQANMRKRNNALLVQLNQELDTANKVKAKFFGIISHDLRGPIARLINFLHLQKNAPGMLNEKQTAIHQEKITEAATTLLDNMENMLLWSKGQMEHFKPSIRPVAINDLFDHIRQAFAAVESVTFSFTDINKIQVSTDEHYLRTIMDNLTSNAVKATQGQPDAKIDWSASIENNYAVLTIHDNGPGMDPVLMQAFNDEAINKDSRYGLGLYIIRDLSKAIHAQIQMQHVEKGTRLQLLLPL